MAISVVGSTTNFAASSTSGITVNLTAIAGLQENDLVVACVNVNATTNLTMTASAGWTIGDLYANDTNDSNLAVAYKFMGASPDASVTFGGSASSWHWAAAVIAFRGVDLTTPWDVNLTGAVNVNGGSPNPGSNTPVTNDCLSVIFGGSTQQGVATAPSGYTGLVQAQNGTNPSNAMIAYQQRTGGAGVALDPGVFGGIAGDGTDSWSAFHGHLRPAAGVAGRTGTMAATESGADAATAAGTVVVAGSLAVAETGADDATMAGAVMVAGTVVASETGTDSAALSGAVAISGTADATETGADTFAGTGATAGVELQSQSEPGPEPAAPTYGAAPKRDDYEARVRAKWDQIEQYERERSEREATEREKQRAIEARRQVLAEMEAERSRKRAKAAQQKREAERAAIVAEIEQAERELAVMQAAIGALVAEIERIQTEIAAAELARLEFAKRRNAALALLLVAA